MKDAEILSDVLTYLRMNTTEFYRTLGRRRPDNIRKILGGSQKISKNLASAIVEKYPQFNIVWLLTGEGPMLRRSEQGQKLRDMQNKYAGAETTWDSVALELKSLEDKIQLLEQIIRDKDAIIALLTDQLKNR